VQQQVADFTHTCFMVTPYEGYGSPWGMEDRTPHDVLLPRSAPPNNAAGTPKGHRP